MSKRLSRHFAYLSLPLAVFTAAAPAWAQQSAADYPSRPLRVIVPLAAGGSMDRVARFLQKPLGEVLHQDIVVEDKAGGNGVIGTDFVVKAEPDGYTMLISGTILVANAALEPKLPYDTLRDLQGVAQLTSTPMLLVVHPSMPIHNFKEFITYAKAHPGQLNHASAGIGTGPHMAMELLMDRTGIKVNQIPYKGGGPAVTDFVAGTTQVFLTNISSLMPLVKDGKARPIATSGLKRASVAPDIPTIAESGVPGFDEGTWNGILVSSKVPKAVVDKLYQGIAQAMQSPELLAQFKNEGNDVNLTKPEVFSQKVRNDVDHWTKEIARAGIKAE